MSDNPTFDIIVRHTNYTVTFNLDTHYFIADVGGVILRSDSVDGLNRVIENEMSRQKVRLNLRFMTEWGKLGTATGIHGRTGHVTVQWDDGQNAQIASSLYHVHLSTDKAELEAVNKSFTDADLARKEFIKAHRFDAKRGLTPLKSLVKEAIEKERGR
jgi:hypothetical protein